MSVFVPSGLRIEQEIPYGRTGKVRFICEVGGQLVVPGASPQVLIFRPGQVEDADAESTVVGTVVSTNFIDATVDATSTATWALGRGYRAKATWTNGGTTHTTTVTFSVVRNPVNAQIPCNENDLLATHVRVEEALEQCGRLGFSGAYYIKEAFDSVVRWLASTKRVPWEVMPRDDLNGLVLPLARAKLFRSVIADPTDMWAFLYKECLAEYQEAQKTLPLHIAEGDDDQPELDRTGSQPTLSAAPDHMFTGGPYGRR